MPDRSNTHPLLDDRIDTTLLEEITIWLQANAKPGTRERVIRRALHRKFGERIQQSIFNRRTQEKLSSQNPKT